MTTRRSDLPLEVQRASEKERMRYALRLAAGALRDVQVATGRAIDILETIETIMDLADEEKGTEG